MKLSNDSMTVFDEKTDLTWQQAGSDNYMIYAEAEKYVANLNAQNFAGHNDWRLPTRDEAMTLLLLQPIEDFYVDPVFDKTQRWIWTADKESAGVAWVVSFFNGFCSHGHVAGFNYVRVVR